jgi:hypothetical protein
LPDITMIQHAILARLAEIDELIEPLRVETEQLRGLLVGLDEGGAGLQAHHVSAGQTRVAVASEPRRKSARAGGAPRGAKRARRAGTGNRAQEALAKIRKQPGITAVELAKSMGIGPNYLYRVLPRLEREGKVAKRGRGYHAAPGDGPAAPTRGRTDVVV